MNPRLSNERLRRKAEVFPLSPERDNNIVIELAPHIFYINEKNNSRFPLLLEKLTVLKSVQDF